MFDVHFLEELDERRGFAEVIRLLCDVVFDGFEVLLIPVVLRSRGTTCPPESILFYCTLYLALFSLPMRPAAEFVVDPPPSPISALSDPCDTALDKRAADPADILLPSLFPL